MLSGDGCRGQCKDLLDKLCTTVYKIKVDKVVSNKQCQACTVRVFPTESAIQCMSDPAAKSARSRWIRWVSNKQCQPCNRRK
jgi:hypothetical protein